MDLNKNVEVLSETLQTTAENVNNYNQGLGKLVHWVQLVESCINGLGNVTEYKEFLSTLTNFQVWKIFFSYL